MTKYVRNGAYISSEIMMAYMFHRFIEVQDNHILGFECRIVLQVGNHKSLLRLLYCGLSSVHTRARAIAIGIAPSPSQRNGPWHILTNIGAKPTAWMTVREGLCMQLSGIHMIS